MPAKKEMSIGKCSGVMVTITGANSGKLADLEQVMVRERRVDGVKDIPNADIINDAITVAHRIKCGGTNE
jgi:hypothetical protein